MRAVDVIIGILAAVMFVLVLPAALVFQLYDYLQDRKFERETDARYGGAE